MKKMIFSKGYTIVEMLVVMLILGIASTIVIGKYTATRERARDAARHSDMVAIAQVAEQSYMNDSNYPSSLLDNTKEGGINMITDKLISIRPKDVLIWRRRNKICLCLCIKILF